MKTYEFKKLKDAKDFCKSLGEISDIKFIENNNGYGYLSTTQYLLTINDKYWICGGSYSVSKAMTVYFVREIYDISNYKLKNDIGYPKYTDVKLSFHNQK